MIEHINTWAQRIIIVVIISAIIEMILPKGNTKKYIKTIIGTYIVFIIIYPIIEGITGNEISLNEIIESTYESKELEEISPTIDTNLYIENEYKETLKKEITEAVLNKNYTVNNVDIEIETKNESKYGEILEITLNITKNNENTNKKIEEININIGEYEKENKDKLTENEKNELIEYLSEIYYTKNIIIQD